MIPRELRVALQNTGSQPRTCELTSFGKGIFWLYGVQNFLSRIALATVLISDRKGRHLERRAAENGIMGPQAKERWDHQHL